MGQKSQYFLGLNQKFWSGKHVHQNVDLKIVVDITSQNRRPDLWVHLRRKMGTGVSPQVLLVGHRGTVSTAQTLLPMVSGNMCVENGVQDKLGQSLGYPEWKVEMSFRCLVVPGCIELLWQVWWLIGVVGWPSGNTLIKLVLLCCDPWRYGALEISDYISSLLTPHIPQSNNICITIPKFIHKWPLQSTFRRCKCNFLQSVHLKNRLFLGEAQCLEALENSVLSNQCSVAIDFRKKNHLETC